MAGLGKMSTSAGPSCRSVVSPMEVYGFGQGKKAATILAEQGHYVTLVTDEPYSARNKHNSYTARIRKGMRPMHKSTLLIPTQNYTDYKTSNVMAFSGSKGVNPCDVAHPYPSQHRSKVTIPHRGEEDSKPWSTFYGNLYHDKGANNPAKLHYPSQLNKLNMTEGGGLKGVMTAPGPRCNTLTQYTRVHDQLGVMRGPGVEREIPTRRAYNILTGEEIGPAWKPDNKRVSGNRVLYHSYRQDADRHFVLG